MKKNKYISEAKKVINLEIIALQKQINEQQLGVRRLLAQKEGCTAKKVVILLAREAAWRSTDSECPRRPQKSRETQTLTSTEHLSICKRFLGNS